MFQNFNSKVGYKGWAVLCSSFHEGTLPTREWKGQGFWIVGEIGILLNQGLVYTATGILCMSLEEGFDISHIAPLVGQDVQQYTISLTEFTTIHLSSDHIRFNAPNTFTNNLVVTGKKYF